MNFGPLSFGLASLTTVLFVGSGCASTPDHVAADAPPHLRIDERAPSASQSESGGVVLAGASQIAPTEEGSSEENAEPVVPASAGLAEDPAAAGEPGAVPVGPPPAMPTEAISLADVLSLADARNPNVQIARERINEAYARVQRADTLWLPSVRAGVNANHHEGVLQNAEGDVLEVSRSALYGGLGANAVGAGSPGVPGLVARFHLADAIFQPEIAGHQAASREFSAAATRNDILRDAAVAYLELVRAEQAVEIAREAEANTQVLVDLSGAYARTGQGLQSDHERMLAELAVRQAEAARSLEAANVASARLAQLLRVDPRVQLLSGEPAVVPLDLVPEDGTAAELVATALSRRPEIAAQRHLVCEAVDRLRREKYAPLVPSLLLGLSYGAMGGGTGSTIANTDDRLDIDAVAFWEIRNLGFGEEAARLERSSLVRQAQWREVLQMDQVAREVVEAHTRVLQRQSRIEIARQGIQSAEQSYKLNLERIRNAQGLPIEALQSVQALAAARRSYLDAVIDFNISQFELSRAIGWFYEE